MSARTWEQMRRKRQVLESANEAIAAALYLAHSPQVSTLYRYPPSPEREVIQTEELDKIINDAALWSRDLGGQWQ